MEVPEWSALICDDKESERDYCSNHWSSIAINSRLEMESGLFRGGTTWMGDLKFSEVKIGFRRKRWMETGAQIYRPSFRKNKFKTLVYIHRKRAFRACFRENWVYNFGHGSSETFIGWKSAKTYGLRVADLEKEREGTLYWVQALCRPSLILFKTPQRLQ